MRTGAKNLRLVRGQLRDLQKQANSSGNLQAGENEKGHTTGYCLLCGLFVLFLRSGVKQRCEHKPTSKSESIGKNLKFYNIMYLINAIVILFEGFTLLRRHGFAQPIVIPIFQFE